MASAKLANSTVNHSHTATDAAKTFSCVVLLPRSRTNRIVVSAEPTSTMNITGLRIIARGFNLRNEASVAVRTRAGSKIERLADVRRRDFGGRGPVTGAGCAGSGVSVAVIMTSRQRQVLEDRVQGHGG